MENTQQAAPPVVFDKMHEVQLLQGIRRMVVDIRCQLPYMTQETKGRISTELLSTIQEIVGDVSTQES